MRTTSHHTFMPCYSRTVMWKGSRVSTWSCRRVVDDVDVPNLWWVIVVVSSLSANRVTGHRQRPCIVSPTQVRKRSQASDRASIVSATQVTTEWSHADSME
eukprot:m.114664 g.114664  ORF g.114664 m.114664 type:complete len:101 (-) comp10852_c0_seq2:197-499(-)